MAVQPGDLDRQKGHASSGFDLRLKEIDQALTGQIEQRRIAGLLRRLAEGLPPAMAAALPAGAAGQDVHRMVVPKCDLLPPDQQLAGDLALDEVVLGARGDRRHAVAVVEERRPHAHHDGQVVRGRARAEAQLLHHVVEPVDAEGEADGGDGPAGELADQLVVAPAAQQRALGPVGRAGLKDQAGVVREAAGPARRSA